MNAIPSKPSEKAPAIGPLPSPEASPDELLAHLRRLREARRERIATAALQGIVAAVGHTGQNAPDERQLALRAVRYADALIDVLNKTTAEALHARHR